MYLLAWPYKAYIIPSWKFPCHGCAMYTWYCDHSSHFEIDIHVLPQYCITPSNEMEENSINVKFAIKALIYDTNGFLYSL